MTLREDGEPYCFLWVGVLILGSYYFSFIYRGFLTVDLMFYLMMMSIFPLLLIFTFTGFLRPVRSKVKPTMLALSVVLALFFWIICILMETEDIAVFLVGEGTGIAIWGIGGALLTAAGFSIMHTVEESSTDGILDVSTLHYGPPPAEEEPEPEPASEEPAESEDSAESTPEAN